MTNYENCCLYDKQKCGRYIGDRSEKSGLVRSLELTSDIESHIRNFDFRRGLECLKWTEKELIENRLGKAIDGSKLICEFIGIRMAYAGTKSSTVCLPYIHHTKRVRSRQQLH